MLRLIMAVLLFALSAAAVAATPALFKRVEQRQDLKSAKPGLHTVEVDRTAIRAAIRGGGLRIDLPGGRSVFAKTLRHEQMDDDNLTWVGVVSLAKEDRTVVITMGRDAVFGSLIASDGSPLELETRNGIARLAAPDFRFDAQREFARQGVLDYVVPKTPKLTQADLARTQQALAVAGPPRVDLLLAYTQGLVTRYGSESAAITRLSYLTSVTNQALQDSKIAGRMRLIGTIKVDYPDTNTNDAVLDALGDASGNSPLQVVRDRYRTLGADLVAMIRPFLTPEHGNCGLAPVNGYNLSSYTTGAAGRAAVSDGKDDDTGYFCNVTTLAHELGHAMGQVHDTENSSAPGPFPYTYGWRQTLPNGRSFHTLMAYGTDGQKSLPYYSNPNLFYCSSTPCGDTAVADQARALNQIMPVVAAINQPSDPVADLNANGDADLIVQTNGEMIYILYSGGSARGSGRQAMSAGYRIAATGDLNADHKADLILTSAANDVLLWVDDRNGGFTQSSASNYPAGDTLVGVADLDRNGKADLLFINAATAKFTYWRMDGATRVGMQTLDIAPGSYIAAVGDFDGDLRTDLMFTSPIGTLEYWRNTTSGFTRTASQSIPAGWKIEGSGDIDNDGRADLVLGNRQTGEAAYWLMSGATRISVTPINLPAGYWIASVDRYSGATASVMLTSAGRDGYLLRNDGAGNFTAMPDRFVFPGYYEHYPVGWSIVSAAPSQP